MLEPSEEQIQSSVFQWAGFYPILRRKYWCIANGGYNLSVAAQAKLKRLGRRPGIPDSMLFARSGILNPINKCPYSGLAIEFKVKNGYLTAAQSLVREDLIEEGWSFTICRSLNEAIKEITNYLGNRLKNG